MQTSTETLPKAPRRVAVLALDGVVPWDVGIPCLIFGPVKLSDGSPAYDVRVCGAGGRIDAGAFGIHAPYALDEAASADTIIVPGIMDSTRAVPQPVLDLLKEGWSAGARIASICTGAFVLAETGLLDGRRATTHWYQSREFADRFPNVSLHPDVLFIDEGRIITSAGASAGLDMCLHLVRRDHGQAVAAQAARVAVAPLDREGGQAQFIRHEPALSSGNLAPILDWALADLQQPIDVERMAARAGASPRTFARRFREQTGTTPLQWLLHARIRRAQELLEDGSQSVETIAAAVGFDSAVTFRARFRRVVGVPPAMYRRRFAGTELNASI